MPFKKACHNSSIGKYIFCIFTSNVLKIYFIYIYKFVTLNGELIILSKQKKKDTVFLKGPRVVSNAMHFLVEDNYLVLRSLSGTLSIIWTQKYCLLKLNLEPLPWFLLIKEVKSSDIAIHVIIWGGSCALESYRHGFNSCSMSPWVKNTG